MRRREYPERVPATDYRALAIRTANVDDGYLHLIREDAESTLCGIPRGALSPADESYQLVCMDCIEWLTKRKAASAKFRAVRPA